MLEKWHTLSVQWKWRSLGLVLFLLFYFSYNFNIRKTIDTVHAYHTLKDRQNTLATSITAFGENPTLKVEGKELNKIQPESLITVLSDFCSTNNVAIAAIEQTSESSVDKYSIETNKVIFRGSYSKLLSLINFLEKNKIAIVNAASFEVKQEPYTQKTTLYSTLYIKSIRYAKAR